MAKTVTTSSKTPTQKQVASTSNVILVKKKKKKKYSKGLKDFQRTEDRLSKATHRLSKAIEKGMDEYRDRRKNSVEDRRDGAIIDFVPNVARGFGRLLEESSMVPYDLSKIVSAKRRKRFTKMVTRNLRFRYFS